MEEDEEGEEEEENQDRASQGVELSKNEGDPRKTRTTGEHPRDMSDEQYGEDENVDYIPDDDGDEESGRDIRSDVVMEDEDIEPDILVDKTAVTPDVNPPVVIPSPPKPSEPQQTAARHGYRLVVPRPSRNIPNLPPLMEVFKAQTGLSSADALKELFGPNKLSWYASRDLDLFELEGDARCARCKDASKRCFRIIGNNCLRCAKSHTPCTVKDMPAPATYINEIESTLRKCSPAEETSSVATRSSRTRSSTPLANPNLPKIAIQKSRSDSSATGLKVRIPPATRASSRGSSHVSSRQGSSVPNSAGDVPKTVSTSFTPGFPSSTNGIIYWNQGLGPRFLRDAQASSSRQVSPADTQMVVATPITPAVDANAPDEQPRISTIPPAGQPTPLTDTTPCISLVGDVTNSARQLRAKHDSLAYRVEASKTIQRNIYQEWQEQALLTTSYHHLNRATRPPLSVTIALDFRDSDHFIAHKS